MDNLGSGNPSHSKRRLDVMTIELADGYWTINCDKCPYAEDEPLREGYTFYEFWSDKSKEGWRAELQEDEEWEHTCPACLAKEARSIASAFKPKRKG